MNDRYVYFLLVFNFYAITLLAYFNNTLKGVFRFSVNVVRRCIWFNQLCLVDYELLKFIKIIQTILIERNTSCNTARPDKMILQHGNIQQSRFRVVTRPAWLALLVLEVKNSIDLWIVSVRNSYERWKNSRGKRKLIL